MRRRLNGGIAVSIVPFSDLDWRYNVESFDELTGVKSLDFHFDSVPIIPQKYSA